MVKRKASNSVSEDDGGEEAANKQGLQNSNSTNPDTKKRLKTRSLYRQPTVNELNRLQETETLFNSNLFRLQVEEILQEVKLKEKRIKNIEKWYEAFKTHMEAIPETETEYDLSENILYKALKVKSAVSGEISKTKCTFKFHKFLKLEMIGSQAIGCSINSNLVLDVLITVPADTYIKNDSINYRYHKKRAAYLACVASHLKKLNSIEDLKYSWQNGCESKPVLDLKPAGKLGEHLTVRIHLGCDPEAYKLHRFSPSRNNLREAWLLSLPNSDSNTDVGPPTPYYNSSVLQDLTASVNLDYLHGALATSENLKQAIVLLKIWLRQRKLQVSGHVVCMFVAHLVQSKRINNIMSSYQIVRNVWISLQTSEWDTKGLTLHKGQDSAPNIEEFLQHFPVVFIDQTGFYNICWQMSKGTYNALRRESTLAVNMLDKPGLNSFIPLFMTPLQQLKQFDHILRFKDIQKVKQAISSKSPKDTKVNYGTDQLTLVVDTIHNLLANGLGDRAELILEQVDADFSWSVKESLEKARTNIYEEKLSFSIILNPETAMTAVMKGPPANLPEAEQFRAFWGDKSELRRFQDGSITETCVWEAGSVADQRMITKQIVKYLLNLKYGLQDEVFYIGDQLDSVLVRKQSAPSDGVIGTGEEVSLRVVQAFDELRRDLRGLTELPLEVSSVYGVSPVFSYSCPLPPTPLRPVAKPWRRGATCLIKDSAREDGAPTCPEYVPVSRAIVELGHSGKWPGDLQAFRSLKAAFHLQLAERLSKQHSLPAQPYPGHVTVLKAGVPFALEIAHPKEITLMRREIENGVVKHKENDESIELQCRTVLLPRLRGALHGLHQKHPAFGPTAALTKRWLSSHLLDDYHFPQTLVELVVASVFLRPEPLAPANQPLAAFMRTMALLANTDWKTEMILLNFNEEITREERTEIERKFSARDVGQPPALYVVTSLEDARPSALCRRAPTWPVLARAQALARSTMTYLETGLAEMKDNLLGAFIPSLTGYDVIIRLHAHLVPYACERVDKRPQLARASETVADDVIPVVDFHPVRSYLQELRSSYSEFALFFHDSYGGDVIAVLWKPEVHDTKEFQVSQAQALKPVHHQKEIKYQVNLPAIIEDFKILGRGLVKDVKVIS